MTVNIRVLGICGSLRKGSFNRMALEAAAQLMPAGMLMEHCEIGTLPHFNADLLDRGFPASVEVFHGALARSDAILFASPEYNFSVSGVLKNAMDWGSRPPDRPMNGKPVAIIGASLGKSGTARGQMHLRQICLALDMHVVNRPEVLIGDAANAFSPNGELLDAIASNLMQTLLLNLCQTVGTLRRVRS